MKKMYTLTAGILLAGAISAQVNLNFEAPITHPSPSPVLGFTTGWQPGIYTAETVDLGGGLQSCKMVTVNDPFTASGTGSPSDTLPGFVRQFIDGDLSHPENIDISFKYKYTSVNNDTALFLVAIYDTVLAGFNDDHVLYQGFVLLPNTPAWSTGSVTNLNHVSTNGTPNRLYIHAAASVGGVFRYDGFILPSPGSTLLVDDIAVSNLAFLGVEENILSGLALYPNPTSDVLKFTLEGNGVTAINVYGLDGKLMLSDKVNGTTGEIDVSSLNAGTYMCEITTASGETVRSTFVKK